MKEKCDIFARICGRKGRVLVGTLIKQLDEEWNVQIIKQIVQIELQFRRPKHYKKY